MYTHLLEMSCNSSHSPSSNNAESAVALYTSLKYASTDSREKSERSSTWGDDRGHPNRASLKPGHLAASMHPWAIIWVPPLVRMVRSLRRGESIREARSAKRVDILPSLRDCCSGLATDGKECGFVTCGGKGEGRGLM